MREILKTDLEQMLKEGLSYDEIADTLGISRSSVYNLLKKGNLLMQKERIRLI